MLTLKRSNYKVNELAFLMRVLETGIDSCCPHGESYTAQNCRKCEYFQICASIVRLQDYANNLLNELAKGRK